MRCEFGATELCIQSGIHPDWGLEDYERWLRFAKELAPQLHLHAYSPMEVAHMCDVSGLAATEVFERLRDAGLGSTPGTAAEVLHDGVRERISPNKLPVARWVEIIEASHTVGLRSTVTVMFGHIEEPWELAEHMRVVRELQERTGGFTEFVPLSFIPFHTLLGRTHGIEEISREENLKHTAAFRLALGRSVVNLQASWVKMGLEAATESLRWGVNDLGGTLMEESISRMAGSYHGVRLEPDELIAAAHRAGRPAAERTTLYEIRARHDLPRRGPLTRGARAVSAGRTPALFAGVEPLEVFVELLAEIDTDPSSTEFYDRICEAICRLTTMRRAAIFMSDAKGRRVRAVGAHGAPTAQLATLRPTLLATPIAQQALRADQVIVISEGIDRGASRRLRSGAGNHDTGVHADVGGRPRLRGDLCRSRRRPVRAQRRRTAPAVDARQDGRAGGDGADRDLTAGAGTPARRAPRPRA